MKAQKGSWWGQSQHTRLPTSIQLARGLWHRPHWKRIERKTYRFGRNTINLRRFPTIKVRSMQGKKQKLKFNHHRYLRIPLSAQQYLILTNQGRRLYFDLCQCPQAFFSRLN
jgi:hypothetical protein